MRTGRSLSTRGQGHSLAFDHDTHISTTSDSPPNKDTELIGHITKMSVMPIYGDTLLEEFRLTLRAYKRTRENAALAIYANNCDKALDLKVL